MAHRPRQIPAAIMAGIGINGAIVVTLVLLTLGLGREVDEVAIVTLGKALGSRIYLLGSVFIVLAMLTSYWAISLALSDIIREQLGWSRLVSWSFATVPGLLIVFLGTDSFLSLLELAGGAVGLVVGLGLVPTYRAVCGKHPGCPAGRRLGFVEKPVFQIVIVDGFLLMAIGAIL